MAGIFVGFRSGLRPSLRRAGCTESRMVHMQSSGCRGKKVGEVRARKLDLRLLRFEALPWITQHERERADFLMNDVFNIQEKWSQIEAFQSFHQT